MAIDLSRFNPQQKDAITHMEGNCVVLASAGSGKTACIVNRIANMIENGIKPERILAITFSRKSADDMKERLAKVYKHADEMTLNTFHSICYRILKTEDVRYNQAELMRDYFKRKIICDIVVRSLKLLAKDSLVDVGAVLTFISTQKNNNLSYKDRLIGTGEMPYSLDIMQEIYMMYELEKIKNNYIDFDDMIMDCVSLLKNKPSIHRKYTEKYKYILVDESQDTNLAQIEFLKLMNGNNNNMFWVGDFRQCIYEFRLSNPKFIMNFYKDWKDARVIQLPLNYRCGRDIIELSNELLKNSPEAQHKYYTPAMSYKGYTNKPEYRIFRTSLDEATFVAEKIKKLKAEKKDVVYKDIAVIMRTNAQSRVFEQVFIENEIPYVVCDSSSFYEKKEIQDMLNYLKVAVNPKDDIAFEKIYNTPSRYLGNVFLQELKAIAEPKGLGLYEALRVFPKRNEWRYKNGIEQIESAILKINKMVGKASIGDIIIEIRKFIGYDAYVLKESTNENNDTCAKVENLDSLCEQGNDYTDVGKFLSDIDRVIKAQKDEKEQKQHKNKSSVQILTCHRSKGLEFKVVFVVGVNNGLLPHSKSCNIDEERRLLYVAITRAEEYLYISSMLKYNDRYMMPSDFLYDMYDEEVIDSQMEEIRNKVKNSNIKK